MYLFVTLILSFLSVLSGIYHKHDEIAFLKTPPLPMIERFTFGFNEPMSDVMWVTSIQGFDYCEEQVSENVCKGKGWLFQMLDSVTRLSPHFRMPYATGAVALSVIITDIEGASIIFDRAVQNYPNDWPILYRAAYHALFEEKNQIKAADLLWRAAKNGAPDWLYSLATKIYTEEGKYELAERLINEIDPTTIDPGILQRAKNRLLEKQAK